MTFYRYRTQDLVPYGHEVATHNRPALQSRGPKPRITQVGFHSFPHREERIVAAERPETQANAWESTARLLRVLASAGSLPTIGHA